MKSLQTILTALILALSINSGLPAIDMDDFEEQQDFWEKASLGFKMGLSLSNQTGMESDTDWRSSFAFGGYFSYKISGHFRVQPEIMFVGKGFRNAEADSSLFGGAEISDKYDIRMNYLEIPILFKFEKGTREAFNPYILAGPVFSVYINGQAEFGSNVIDAGVLTNRTDMGLGFGAGAEIPMGEGLFLTEIRYNLGGVDVFESGEAGVRNRNLIIMIGFGF